MNSSDLHTIIAILRQEYRFWNTPAVSIVAQCEHSPFKVLVSCIISLRTRDEVTALASQRLFDRAGTPELMQAVPIDEVAALIYPAGFYRTKALQMVAISKRLVAEFNGGVPDEIDQLLTFKGIGRKTANLVVTLGFGKPGICVDTHVHRICNRWGYVATRTPDQTEVALRMKLPAEYWLEINEILVAFGQNLCHPISPRCSECRLNLICTKIGVKTWR